MDQESPKPAAPGLPQDSPMMSRGVIAGVVVIVILAVAFGAAVMTGTFGTGSPDACDTKDGTCAVTTTKPAATATPTPAPPIKSARPAVELYVMAFCPYGVQMESAMRPVVSLLGNATDIRVRYIASVRGDTLSSIQSLHGNAEGVEDVRQVCIAKYAPGSYWEYIKNFNAQCYPKWNNATTLAACQQNVTAALGLTADTITQCIDGGEGLALLKEDAALVTKNNARSSPTLLINGQKFTGARTPENVKQAICSHFETSPAECITALSTQVGSKTGSC